MKARFARLIVIVLLLAVSGAAYWYFSRNPMVWRLWLVGLGLGTPEAEKTGIYASGFIEVRQVTLAPEVSGRINQLTVAEGDQVVENQILVEIDADLLEAQIAEAEAVVALSEARLARVKAGVRAEEVALAEAAVVLAEAQRNAAYQAWQDAILLRDTPQELDMEIIETRSQLAVLEHRIEQMTAFKDGAELISSLRERQVDFVEQGIDWSVTIPGYGKKSGHFGFGEGEKRQVWAAWNLATTDVWSAWVGLNQAIAARDTARQNLDNLLAMRANAQQARVRVAQAEATYRQASAAVEVASANLDRVRAGAKREQIEFALKGVDQARAALDALKVQRQKYTLRAPIAGIVLERIVHEGEMALSGANLLTLGNLDRVDLTIYVPEPEIGQVFLGQPVNVSVDSFPDEIFLGQVVWISDQAEFTPKNIQTKEERVNTVFAVRISITNPDHRLKPGMPADAWLNIQ